MLKITDYQRNASQTTVRLAIIKKQKQKQKTNNESWRGCREKRIILYRCQEYPVRRTVWRFLKKLTTGLPCDLAILLLSKHTEKRNRNSKRCIHSRVHCSTVYNSQDMEAIEMSVDRKVDKEDVVHIYKGILLSHKK